MLSPSLKKKKKKMLSRVLLQQTFDVFYETDGNVFPNILILSLKPDATN